MYKVIINNINSERAANFIKQEIEELLPFADGNIEIYKEPEVKPLNEVIEDLEAARKSEGCSKTSKNN